MYARGILFGKMKYELGDHSFVRCPELGLTADIEFKTKGYFTGSYNAIGGTIKNDKTGEVLYELSGMWTGEMDIKNVATGKKDVLFDALKTKPTPPLVRPLEEQGERESQKLWYRTAQAVIARNHEVATDEKTAVEDMQRREAAARLADGVEWRPRYFREVRTGLGESEEGEEGLDWILNADMYVLSASLLLWHLDTNAQEQRRLYSSRTVQADLVGYPHLARTDFRGAYADPAIAPVAGINSHQQAARLASIR